MSVPRPNPPMAMLAELTHRCPLACPYCSNPLELERKDRELTTDEWKDVFTQAAEMGVLHVHFSGGEPASRRDSKRWSNMRPTLVFIPISSPLALG